MKNKAINAAPGFLAHSLFGRLRAVFALRTQQGELGLQMSLRRSGLSCLFPLIYHLPIPMPQHMLRNFSRLVRRDDNYWA
jgi:hypothetical protein